MKITDFEVQKNNEEKMNIYVDNEYKFSMTLDAFLNFKIVKGMEITQELIDEIKKADSPKLAYLQILTTLKYGMKTEKEMIDKLKSKGFQEDAITEAINKAKEYNYINDDYYIECYIRSKAIPSKWGEQKIISNLYLKGIDINVIKEKLKEFISDDSNYQNAYELARKKIKTIKDNDKNKIRQKLNQYLLGRGYRYDIISRVINELVRDDY